MNNRRPASLRGRGCDRGLCVATARRGRLVSAWASRSGLHARANVSAVEALLPKLSLSYEANVPTWFSSSLLLACAIAAGAIAASGHRWHRHWWGMRDRRGVDVAR